jgi:hypothetical protein
MLAVAFEVPDRRLDRDGSGCGASLRPVGSADNQKGRDADQSPVGKPFAVAEKTDQADSAYAVIKSRSS